MLVGGCGAVFVVGVRGDQRRVEVHTQRLGHWLAAGSGGQFIGMTPAEAAALSEATSARYGKLADLLQRPITEYAHRVCRDDMSGFALNFLNLAPSDGARDSVGLLASVFTSVVEAMIFNLVDVLAEGYVLLARRPELLRALSDDRRLVGATVEEYFAPVREAWGVSGFSNHRPVW
jgi:hypothetical protein